MSIKRIIDKLRGVEAWNFSMVIDDRTMKCDKNISDKKDKEDKGNKEGQESNLYQLMEQA